ncbi:feruloyl esteras-like protein B precursor [Amylocarpus encephaloides]|uniref:Carboxylic ester hydrolase n=1 Tax=Amylocarpus encephaloides TaxID=45428 RepID=A0A9P8C1J5_9HELO|nr:feruloyl esteras-like protein B precursor [Amylocarpus encephaloides]
MLPSHLQHMLFQTPTQYPMSDLTSLYDGTIAPAACAASSIPYPSLYGAEFLSLETNLISNYSENVHSSFYSNHGSVNITNASFCNVTVSYTHPGRNDKINVQVWLPADSWNGRLQMVGGGGWQAGLSYFSLMAMTAAMGEGYSTVSTDAGLGSDATPVNWGLLSPGNVNLNLLQDLASVSLNDAAVIAKSITNSFYGQPPKYSYFSGCSQGGRQGLMLAQKYPEAFDGIAASAPANNWNSLLMTIAWPQFLMDSLKEYPPSCEFDAITTAAVEACDGKDGLVDGIVSDDRCVFDPMTLVGKTINCTNFGTERQISPTAATIVQSIWSGPKTRNNTSIWFGPNRDSSFSAGLYTPAMISNDCSSNGTCSRQPLELSEDWIKLFVLKNASADLSTMTHEQFDRVAHASFQEYHSMLDTNDPDLSRFRDRGGKMVGYHGMADAIIPVRGSEYYYDTVAAMDSNVHDYYRLFLAPGIAHCFGGAGAYPDTTFDAMRKWVEEGTTPDTLDATIQDTTPAVKRPLCPYPKRQVYRGISNSATSDQFECW